MAQLAEIVGPDGPKQKTPKELRRLYRPTRGPEGGGKVKGDAANGAAYFSDTTIEYYAMLDINAQTAKHKLTHIIGTIGTASRDVGIVIKNCMIFNYFSMPSFHP